MTKIIPPCVKQRDMSQCLAMEHKKMKNSKKSDEAENSSPRADAAQSNQPCIAAKPKGCADCDLEEVIMCSFSKKETVGFVIGNTLYRLTAIALFVFAGVLTGIWWMMWAYGILVASVFIIIEPRLLCSHCPFYTMKGKVLKCGGLWGMPKIWKYRPEPISTSEKRVMLILGSFIDLGPFIGLGMGIYGWIKQPEGNLWLGIGMTITAVVFFGLVYYFGKILLGDRCKRCPNFSCQMNAVPEKYITLFLQRNEVMRAAWQKAGWKQKDGE